MKSIFVSSTFKDMQFERDMLHLHVLPEIKSFLAKYHESVYFADLRWGVNTTDLDSDEGANKVLSICLNKIDECRPFMIIFIGERYGWIPRISLIKDTVKDKLVIDSDLSVTALEIEYGALNKEVFNNRCLFYFRDEIDKSLMNEEERLIYSCESEEANKRNNELKEKIIKMYPDRVRHYNVSYNPNTKALEGFGKLTSTMIEDIKNLLKNELDDKLEQSKQDNEIKNAQFFLKKKEHNMKYIRTIVYEYIADLKVNNLLVIKGVTGSGKSTIMAKIFSILKEEKDVIPFCCGSSEYSSTLSDLLDILNYSIEQRLGLTNALFNHNNQRKGIDEEIDYFTELCIKYEKSNNEELIILIDALDQLNYHDKLESLKWLPKTTLSKIHFIISCTDKTKIPIILPNIGNSLIRRLDILDDKEINEVIDGILTINGKEISDVVFQKILEKKSAKNPLYLSMLSQRLLMFNNDDYSEIRKLGDGMKAINKYMIDIIENLPSKVTTLAKEIFVIASNRFNKDIVYTMVELLSLTRNGLRPTDIEQIFKLMNKEFSYLEMEGFLKYLDLFFIKKNDGHIDFSHKTIRSGISVSISNKDEYNNYILTYLKQLPDEDELKSSELVYHAYIAKDTNTIIKYIEENNQSEKLEMAATAIYHFAVKDNGSYLISTFVGIEDINRRNEYKYFISEYIYNQYGKTRDQLLLNLKVMEEATKVFNSIDRDYLLFDKVIKLKTALGKYDDAIEILKSILDNFTFNEANKTEFIIECFDQMIDLLLKQNRTNVALEYGSKLIKGIDLLIECNVLYKNDYIVILAIYIYSKVLIKNKQYNEAITKLKEILDFIDVKDYEDKVVIQSYIYLSLAYEGCKMYEEAIIANKKAFILLKHRIDIFGNDYYWYLCSLLFNSSAKLLVLLNKKKEAVDYYNKSKDIIDKIMIENDSIDYSLLCIKICFEIGCLGINTEDMFLTVQYNAMKILEKTFVFDAVDYLIRMFAKEAIKEKYKFKDIDTILARYKEQLSNDYINSTLLKRYIIEANIYYKEFKQEDLEKYSLVIDNIMSLYKYVTEKEQEMIIEQIYYYNITMIKKQDKC